MLKSIDTAIGFTVVFLVFSLGVTAITQIILALSNVRGRHLRDGLRLLLRQLSPSLSDAQARDIAEAALYHPLVALESSWLAVFERIADGRIVEGLSGWFRADRARAGLRLGAVIEREEFIKLLAGFVAGTEPLNPRLPGSTTALAGAMSFANPEAARRALRDLRAAALQLEVDQPGLATHVRQTRAIAATLDRDFVAGVNNWFDQAMGGVSSRFTGHSRFVTVTISILAASAFQLDAFQVYNRISVDPALRQSLFAQAAGAESLYVRQKAGQAASAESVWVTTRVIPAADSAALGAMKDLARSQIISLPDRMDLRRLLDWRHWSLRRVAAPGIVLSWALLGFGAPFWFNLLGELLRLRPALAAAEDAQRVERATTQAPAPPPSRSG